MSVQMRTLGIMGIVLFAVSVFGILLTALMMGTIPEKATGYDIALMFVRIASLVFMCASIAMSFTAFCRIIGAYSSPALMWKNIRETANDEKVYEQTLSINRLNKTLYMSRNNLVYSAMLMSVGVVAVTATYVIKMFVSIGYL